MFQFSSPFWVLRCNGDLYFLQYSILLLFFAERKYKTSLSVTIILFLFLVTVSLENLSNLFSEFGKKVIVYFYFLFWHRIFLLFCFVNQVTVPGIGIRDQFIRLVILRKPDVISVLAERRNL